MFLIFNKEFRETEKTMSILYSKAKKSEKLERVYEKDEKNEEWEVFKLDTMDVCFYLPERKLVVKDKAGKKIIELDCHYDGYNELQDAKSNQFSALLQAVRKLYDKRVESQKMKDATAQAKKAAAAKAQAENAEQAKLRMLADANDKLRNM